MSIILALDTATEACSAALLVGEKVYTEFAICPREHNKRLLVMLDNVLKQADVTLGDIDVIAFGQGPGSFTGVRIATGIVQGVAFGADKPVIGVSSLAAMAHGVFRRTGVHHVISAIDARMNEIYLAAYQISAIGKVTPVLKDKVCKPQDSLSFLNSSGGSSDDSSGNRSGDSSEIAWSAIGTGWQTYEDELCAQMDDRAHIKTKIDNEHAFPEALDIAYLARTEFELGNTTDPALARPIYVRDEVTWQKMPGK